MTHPIHARLARAAILPVVVIDDASRAGDLARALQEGGIGAAEVTLRTDAGLAAIEAMNDVAGFLVGAGTVLNAAQAEEALSRGARFVVSPGFDEGTAAACERSSIPYLPGVATATELQRVLNHGIDHVKLFPAGDLGGRSYIDSLSGPFPGARFLPSGGVTQAGMGEYLAAPAVFAVSGSWMVPREAVRQGDFHRIRALAAAAVAALPTGVRS